MCSHTTHAGHQLFTENLPINVDDLFNFTFSDGPFFRHFMSKRKAHDICVKDWSPINSSITMPSFFSEEHSFKQVRCLNYILELEGALVSTVSTIETQYLWSDSESGKSYTINSEVVNSGVPLSNCFVVHSQYCLTADPDKSGCILTVHTHVVFKKYVWGVKSLIEENINQQMTSFFKDFIDTLLDWTSGRISPNNGNVLIMTEDHGSDSQVPISLLSDPLASLKGSLKRGKKSPPNSLPGSRGGSLRNFQRDAVQISDKPSDPLFSADNSIGKINGFLVKIILFLALSILILNLLLYVRLMNLEESVRIFGDFYHEIQAKPSSHCDYAR